ncbi:succinate dehydrogenase / fumarate reductase cytochrome b subunit [Caulobacter ginsengisoli]|uniref:Succinate dehydrogenase cytochrome b556 subunit n=1 Tax=Caulobacter ginsengisoli TaxID=400775 RepID=A0ABU0J0J5_9CAUL|nr:succinate dehydrogenase, cytochrome b556 subunit [Caulobacter ginsengisoli]MDQ0466814.1 succinate dehydrogenase / fumarate reductase cytochrome b subunit [Caulobacter ginsengisoli]
MTQASPGARERPMSPHLQVWRWHVTMLTSILHRMTGVGLYVGALIGAGWALALASGPDAYHGYMSLLASPLGRLVLFGLTVALFYHLANGLRHLVWDSGKGLDIKTANFSSILIIAFALAASVAVWAIAFSIGAVK